MFEGKLVLWQEEFFGGILVEPAARPGTPLIRAGR